MASSVDLLLTAKPSMDVLLHEKGTSTEDVSRWLGPA